MGVSKNTRHCKPAAAHSIVGTFNDCNVSLLINYC